MDQNKVGQSFAVRIGKAFGLFSGINYQKIVRLKSKM
jgi:hypothetical protein